MIQNVVTNEEMNAQSDRPSLRLVTTSGEQAASAPSFNVAQMEDNVIVLKFQTAASSEQVRSAARSRRIMDKVFDYAMVGLAASSALAGGVALITMSHI